MKNSVTNSSMNMTEKDWKKHKDLKDHYTKLIVNYLFVYSLGIIIKIKY